MMPGKPEEIKARETTSLDNKAPELVNEKVVISKPEQTKIVPQKVTLNKNSNDGPTRNSSQQVSSGKSPTNKSSKSKVRYGADSAKLSDNWNQ